MAENLAFYDPPSLKGVFSKLSGDKVLFFELESSNFGYLLIFLLHLTQLSIRMIGQHLHYTFSEPHNLTYLNKARRAKNRKIERSPRGYSGLDCSFVLIPLIEE